jgi:hypothetical protein
MKNRAHVMSAAILAIAASVLAPRTDAANAVGAPITYQGRLNQNGVAANGSFDLRFTLYDTLAGGNVVGSPVIVSNTPVAGGVFTVTLDFGAAVWNGASYGMQIAVRPVNTVDFVPLSPLQPITPAPYALYSKAGVATSLSCAGCVASASLASGAVTKDKIATAGATAGQTLVYNGSTLAWQAPPSLTLPFSTVEANTVPLFALTNTFGVAVSAVHGSPAMNFLQTDAGLAAASDNGPGIAAGTTHADSSGIYAEDQGGGIAGAAIRGHSATGYGISATSQNIGLYGKNVTSGTEAYLGALSFAGDFYGNVSVHGTLSKSGGSFKIDHPLDPANKTLSHSFVESPDMMNIYNGLATLDALGEAIIELPAWFEALNRDYRYQLTSIGAPAPNLHVAEKVVNGRFRISGGPRHGEVSWQVTGIRHDAWAEAHRIPVEEEKPEAERGYYETPEEHGQPASKSVSAVRKRGGRR